MSEEIAAPAVAQDTPPAAPDVPTTGEGHAEVTNGDVNWQQRYDSLRSEFDRRNPDYALLERARQGDFEALSELGLPVEFADEQEDPGTQEESDPEALAYDPEALQQFIQQQIQQGVQEALSPFQQQQVEQDSAAQLLAIDGFDQMPPEAQDHVWRIAQSLPPTRDGLYDVQGAYQQFEQLQSALQNSWAASKPAGAPVGRGGQAATDVPPNEDASPQELIKWAQERMRDLSS